MPTVKDNAICLRLMDWSETSQIVVLLTEEHGKISATAKGAKRQSPSAQARFSGGVELLTRGEAVYIVKPSTELANLIEWDMHDAHWHLRSHLLSYHIAMYAADLVHHLLQDHDAHRPTYNALSALLTDLQNAPQAQACLLRFQWNVITDTGLRPMLDRDAETGEPLDLEGQTLAFSAAAGGVVADTGQADRWRVRRTTVELLRDVEAGTSLSNLDPESIQRANRLLCVYFRAILNKQLPTMEAILGNS